MSATPIASTYYLVKVGGDIAVLKGIHENMSVALDAKSLAEAAPVSSTVNSSRITPPESTNCWLTSMRLGGTPSRRLRACHDRISSFAAYHAKAERSSSLRHGSPSTATDRQCAADRPIC